MSSDNSFTFQTWGAFFTEPEGSQLDEGFPTIYHYLVAGYWTESNAGEKESG